MEFWWTSIGTTEHGPCKSCVPVVICVSDHVILCLIMWLGVAGEPKTLTEKKKKKKKRRGKKGRAGDSSEDDGVPRPVVNVEEGEMPDGAASSDDGAKKGDAVGKMGVSVTNHDGVDLKDALNQNLDM